MRSREAAQLIGISYRQLDYLAHCGVLPSARTGSGNARCWDPDVVVRLTLANHIAHAVPASAPTPFPEIARLAVHNPQRPPRRGYALLAPDPPTLLWAATWADVRRVMDDVGAAVVVRYDLDDLVGEHVDLVGVLTLA